MGKSRQDSLKAIITDIFEGFGPLKWLLSQGMLAFSPFLDGSTRTHWEAAAQDLENKTYSQSLHEEKIIKS